MVGVVTDLETVSGGSFSSHSTAIGFVHSVHRIKSEHKGSLERK